MYYSQDIIYRVYVRNDSEKAHAAVSEILRSFCSLREMIGPIGGSIILNGNQLPFGKKCWPSPVEREFAITARFETLAEQCLYRPDLMEKINKLQNGSYASVIYGSRYNSLIGCFGSAAKQVRPLTLANGDSWLVHAPLAIHMTAPKKVWAEASGFVTHTGVSPAVKYRTMCQDIPAGACGTTEFEQGMVADDSELQTMYRQMTGEILVEDARSIYMSMMRDIYADLEIRLFDLSPEEAGRVCGNETRKILKSLRYNVTSVETVPGDAIKVTAEVKPCSRLYAGDFFRIGKAFREMNSRRSCRMSIGNGTPIILTGEYTAVCIRQKESELAFEVEEVIPQGAENQAGTSCHLLSV